MVISGINAIRQALLTKSKIEKIIISQNFNNIEKNPLLDLANEQRVQIEYTTPEKINALKQDKNAQGILAFVPEYNYYNLYDILDKKEDAPIFLVILDSIMDPHNLGAIIRTSECAGVTAVIVPKNRACPINETVYKTSAGAIFNMPVVQVTNINDTIRKLKEKNIWVYGMEANGSDIYKTNLTGDVALVIGSEGDGISTLTTKLCDQIVSLPLLGTVNSLNASNAASIGIYEIVRQRG